MAEAGEQPEARKFLAVQNPGEQFPRWPQPMMKGKWKIADVVPADLARELYEALKKLTNEALDGDPLDVRVQVFARQSIARYEREVNRGP